MVERILLVELINTRVSIRGEPVIIDEKKASATKKYPILILQKRKIFIVQNHTASRYLLEYDKKIKVLESILVKYY